MSDNDNLFDEQMTFGEAMRRVAEETEKLAEEANTTVVTAVLVTVNMKKGLEGDAVLDDPEGIVFRVSCVSQGSVVPPPQAISYILQAAADNQHELGRQETEKRQLN